MRSKTLAVASVSLVVIAGAVVAGAAVAQETPIRYSANQPVAGQTYVIVKPNDTVYGLGREFGVRPADIIAINNIAPPYHLTVGQQVILPDQGVVVTTTAQRAQTGAIRGEPAPQAVAAVRQSQQPRLIKVSASRPDDIDYTTEPPASDVVVLERLDAIYTVKQGDTMYSLASRFGMSIEELAQANNIAVPYTIAVSQRLVIPGAVEAPVTTQVAAASLERTIPSATRTPEAERAARELGYIPAVAETNDLDQEGILISKTGDSRFSWPLRGAIIDSYGTSDEGLRNDGINIAAPIGAPIRAAADGEVIYTGAELEGYGNLLLLRHEDGWVSAYAHADSIVVKKGDKIRQGQVVAKVGKTGDVAAPQLHFELRHELQPRDPLAALEGRDLKAVSVD